MTVPDFFSEIDIDETTPDFFANIDGHQENFPESQASKRQASPQEQASTPDFYTALFEKQPSLYEKSKKFLFPKNEPPDNILDPYRVEEKTPEELDAMSPQEQLAHIRKLQRFTDLRKSRGFIKGGLSGLTLSASEHIPGLKPDEEDLMVGIGEAVGSFLPISKLYNFVGKPLVNIALKSPVAKQGLASLARMTGFGVTGATYKAGKDLVHGELPTPKELGKEALVWAGIDAGLQLLGLTAQFSQAVRNIAEKEGIPAKEVIGKLWDSTKNFLKKKFISPESIAEPEIEVLMAEAEKAEAQGLPETEIEVRPREVGKPREIGFVAKPQLEHKAERRPKIQPVYELSFEEAEEKLKDLHEAERAIIEPKVGKEIYEGQYEKQGFEGQRQFWDKYSNRFKDEELDRLEKLPYSAEDLRGRLNDLRGIRTSYNLGETPEESINQVIRDVRKALINYQRPENQALIKYAFNFLSEKGHTKDEVAKEVFKVMKNDLSSSDAEYVLNNLFGKKPGRIEVKTGKSKPAEAEPEAVEGGYTREDFANKQEAQEYLDHLEKSLQKAPEAHKQVLKRDIRNLESIVAGFEKEERLKGEPETLASKTTSKKTTQVPPKQTRPRQPVFGKKQAVARSKILDLFRTAFTDPIRLGKISQKNAAGIHKLWPKVTRLLNDNDIGTASHAIGHNLHTTIYGGNAATPQEQVKNIEAALRPYLAELKPLAHYEPWGMEGFAEFTRLYVTNPEVAQELAPKFYAKFEADLGAQYPEMKNALLQAREYYDTYLQGTPQSRIRAQTSYGADNGKLANIIDGVKKYLKPDFLKKEFLDDVFPAKRLVAEAFGIPLSEVENLKDERNLYRSLRVLKGSVGKGDVFVLHETFDAKTLKKTGGSLRDILKKLPNEEAYREFNDYLISRRSIEKTAQNIKTGINAGDALIVEQELRPKYGELAKELDKYNDALLNYAKDSGLLSPEQYAAIKENNVLYTPFQRVMEVEKGGAAMRAGKLQAGKPIKRMKGSTRDIIAPIESIIKNTYSIIINAEKNLSGQVLANLAKTKPNIGAYVEHVPTPIKLKGKVEGEQVARDLAKRFEREGLDDLIEYDQNGKPVLRADISDAIPEVFLRFGAGQYPAGENIVTAYFDGKPKYYQVSPDLFEMWTKGIAPYTAGLITKILRMPARTLRAGAILNPKFIEKNFIRDTWGSWLFTKYGKSIKDPVGLLIDTLYSPLEMMASAAMKRTLYIEWMKAGGGMSTMQSLDRNAVSKKLEEVRHGYKPYHVVKWLRQIAEISEEANRLNEFSKALAVEQKSRLGAEIAAFAARDLSIDFAKMGLQTKALNQIIPFWNATVQGGDKLLRTMANPEERKNFIPRIIGFIMLPSLILAWLNTDDDRIKEFHEEEKDFNFITFVGDKAIKIPVPFETGVLSHGLTQRMFNHFMKEDPEAFEGFMGSILSAMLPNAIPTFANPFIESWSNKNFFTGGRIIPRNQEELISKYQYKRGTSSTARLLGRAMTYMLGQETRSKAASPEIIDHFINAWTGGLGRVMINISDSALEAAGLSEKVPGPGQTIVEKLGFDAFAARYPRASTRSIEKFYDNYTDATSRMKSIKYAEKMLLETPESQEAAYKRFDKIYDYGTLQHAYKAIQASQREINNIWNDPSIENELKEKMVDDLYLQQIEFAKAANEDIRKYRLTQKE